MPQVGVSCTALFALSSLTDVELEGCHNSLGVDSPSDGKVLGPRLQGLWILLAENHAAISSRPLAQRASPECSIDGVLDVSSADTVSPESFYPRRATSEGNLLAAYICRERPRSAAPACGVIRASGA